MFISSCNSDLLPCIKFCTNFSLKARKNSSLVFKNTWNIPWFSHIRKLAWNFHYVGIAPKALYIGHINCSWLVIGCEFSMAQCTDLFKTHCNSINQQSGILKPNHRGHHYTWKASNLASAISQVKKSRTKLFSQS